MSDNDKSTEFKAARPKEIERPEADDEASHAFALEQPAAVTSPRWGPEAIGLLEG